MPVPQTTSVEVRQSTLYWRNTSFEVSVEEAKAIADEIRERMSRPTVDSILVDNRDASGVWPTEVDAVWNELMADIYAEGVPCATICASVSNALQIDRLSKDNDTDDLIKAFEPSEETEALEFVDAATLQV